MTSRVSYRDTHESAFVASIFHVVQVGAQNEMPVAWQDSSADFVRSWLIIPHAATNIASMHDDQSVRDRLPARLLPGETVSELHAVFGDTELSVTALTALGLLHDRADPQPAGISDRDAFSEALKDWPRIRLTDAGVTAEQRFAVVEGEEVAATVNADGWRGTLLGHQDHPPGEPRAVATVPGHSCVNYTICHLANAYEALKPPA